MCLASCLLGSFILFYVTRLHMVIGFCRVKAITLVANNSEYFEVTWFYCRLAEVRKYHHGLINADIIHLWLGTRNTYHWSIRSGCNFGTILLFIIISFFFFDIQYYRIIIGLSEFKYKFTKGNLYAPVQLSKHILLLWYIPIWQLSQQDWVVQCMFIIKSRWAIWIKPSSCSAFSWAQSSRPPLVAFYFQTRQKVTQHLFHMATPLFQEQCSVMGICVGFLLLLCVA